MPLNLKSVIPVVYIKITVDQLSRNSSQRHNYICMYNNVPTTFFGRFLTGHHQVGIQCQRKYIPTINIDISVSVSTEKVGGGGRDLVYKIQSVWLDRCWKYMYY